MGTVQYMLSWMSRKARHIFVNEDISNILVCVDTMSKRKDSGADLRKATVTVGLSGKADSKQTEADEIILELKIGVNAS